MSAAIRRLLGTSGANYAFSFDDHYTPLRLESYGVNMIQS
jgi:hypothetical protein